MSRELSAGGPARHRSGLVTALAWFFIVSGSGIAVLVLAIMLVPQLSLPLAEAAVALERDSGAGGLTGAAHWLLVNRSWLLMGLLLGSASTVIAAVALLQRRRWARQAFLALMMSGFVATFAAVALAPMVFSLLPDATLPEVDTDNPLGGLVGILAIGIIGATLLAGLFGWVGWKLTSPPIRGEFDGRRRPIPGK